ncbi:hypothetical protein G7Y89_g887 [Cudoniella acicularis]|uniref:Uncharacterized protein n=1 Tax=Cudoniella acicularis TaxID=354080 RepID=A0A8H4RY29_9HELO|nr:hypothetical protein G7Y89_g887 [Cudoniella acicularis]
MIAPPLSLIVAGLFVRLCVAQAAGWTAGEVNTTMCQWVNPRAAVIRDTLYIDGGILWWQPGMSDGTYGTAISDGNPLGLVYLLNFSTPFNTSSNISSIFTTISKAPNGGAANNIGPQYYDGAMFANDYEWYTYGGLLSLTAGYELPPDNQVAVYEAYASGPPKQFIAGFRVGSVPIPMTRYVTNGAAVSVPSENLGFYFGGLRSPTWGDITYLPDNDTTLANVESTTLIQLNMTVQTSETWNNNSLPTTVPGRANAELVWVPVSANGVLVAIGGVINPTFATDYQSDNASETAQSQQISPTFMETVAVYDIATGSWYEQNTTGDIPGQLTQGCTVLASAPDGSSHNIYWYGGFDGLKPTSPFNDDVYVLSLPSFIWKRVYTSTATTGRAGHKCAQPYPDQMIVVGGYPAEPGTSLPCVDPFIRIFNLTSLTWIDSYNPNVWSNYTVPPLLAAVIGGSATGSATQTKPSSGFSNSSMTALFGTSYNSSKITTWYPYQAAATNTSSKPTITPTIIASSSSSTPAYLAPVLGVVLGLIVISLIILGIVLFKKKRLLKLNGNATQSEIGTINNNKWVTNWLRSTPVDAKAPTVTTDETPMTPGVYEDESVSAVPEMSDSQIHEMMDTSRPIELHDTGFVPIVAGGKKSNGGLGHSTSTTSHASHGSDTSEISRFSNTSGQQQRPGISPVPSPRPDSPPVGSAVGSPPRTRIGSGISNVSETDRGHLRGISDTSVSTTAEYATPMESGLAIVSPDTPSSAAGASELPRQAAISPLTPPEGASQSGDYLGAGLASGSGNQKRRSNFSEKLDEVDEK